MAVVTAMFNLLICRPIDIRHAPCINPSLRALEFNNIEKWGFLAFHDMKYVALYPRVT
jgi:hypothetical protein